MKTSLLTSLRITGLALATAFAGLAFAADQHDQLRANLSELLEEGAEIKAIAETPLPNVYRVEFEDRYMFVTSKDEFLMVGDVYDTKRRVNLGTELKNNKMAEAVAAIDAKETIVMGDTDSDRYITIFTDTDCGYCQRLHSEIPALTAGGLQVRYVFFPRAGLDSPSYHEAVSVWCADDQGEAMTLAKAGSAIEPATCANPVAKQYELGQKIGIRGTPTMILDNGDVIPGYVPAPQLLQRAGLKS